MFLNELHRDILDQKSHQKVRLNSNQSVANRTSSNRAQVLSSSQANSRRVTIGNNSASPKKSAVEEPKKLDLRPITIPVATNVNNRLKKYANFLFESCETGRTTGKY